MVGSSGWAWFRVGLARGWLGWFGALGREDGGLAQGWFS